MTLRRRLRIGWWLLAGLAFGAFAVVTIFDLDGHPPSIVRVVGEADALWAESYEGAFLQGGESAWWVSTDGGVSWSRATPPVPVSEADAVEEGCSAVACYRLVDGARIERRPVDGSTWVVEHVRPAEDAPGEHPGLGRDEDRSIAVAGGGDIDAVAVAAGDDGALVRGADGAWRSEEVAVSWAVRLRWWIVGIAWFVSLVGALAGDLLIRYLVPEPEPSRF